MMSLIIRQGSRKSCETAQSHHVAYCQETHDWQVMIDLSSCRPIESFGRERDDHENGGVVCAGLVERDDDE